MSQKRLYELLSLNEISEFADFLGKNGIETSISGDNGALVYFPKIKTKNLSEAEKFMTNKFNFLNTHANYSVNFGIGKINEPENSNFYEMQIYAFRK